MTARLRGIAAAVTVALVCAVGLSGCSESTADEITYAVDGTLTTYNTNYRRRCRLGWAAGVLPGADRVQLSRA